MTSPARKIRWRGTGEYRDDTEALLEQPGDTAAVIRTRPRSLLIRCPDGCGDTLVINLDPRAGKAWSLTVRDERCTLYPSVWREDGCRSHFIVWRDHIVWCGRFEYGNEEPSYDGRLETKVIAALDEATYRSGSDIAIDIEEIPWDVLRVLRRLVRGGTAEEGDNDRQGHFRLAGG